MRSWFQEHMYIPLILLLILSIFVITAVGVTYEFVYARFPSSGYVFGTMYVTASFYVYNDGASAGSPTGGYDPPSPNPPYYSGNGILKYSFNTTSREYWTKYSVKVYYLQGNTLIPLTRVYAKAQWKKPPTGGYELPMP